MAESRHRFVVRDQGDAQFGEVVSAKPMTKLPFLGQRSPKFKTRFLIHAGLQN
jgi:hypothetical protein